MEPFAIGYMPGLSTQKKNGLPPAEIRPGEAVKDMPAQRQRITLAAVERPSVVVKTAM